MIKLKNLAISIMSFVFIVAVGLAITVLNENKVVHAVASISVEYKENYSIGESVTIQSAEFDYQGKKYQANVLVRFPNGSTYKYAELLLEEPGNYYVEYSAVADDNVLLQETKSFTVLDNVYSFEGEGKYEYGSNAYLNEDVKGLNVSLGRNSTFTINKPIDVSNLTKEDSILKFYATPAMKGASEVGVFYVRLTDVHDKDKYIELQYRPVGTFQYVYASANGQLVTGLRQTSSPTQASIEYDGYYYNLSHNNVKNAGHVTRVSLTGVVDTNNATNLVSRYFPNDMAYTEKDLFFYNSLEVRMDYAQKRVYSQPDGVYAISRSIVADFDDERTLGGKTPWEGFTTGEVFVSIYAKDYTASSFNFFLTDVYGQEVSEATMKNEIPPRLSVDTQDYDINNLPNAIVGKDYKLFDANALDDADGEVDVSVKVFNSVGSTLSVVNNSFIATQAGVYTIEYTAKDSFENKTVKTFKVKAIDRDSIEYQLSNEGTQFRAGESVSVKKITLSNPSNLYELKISAKNTAQNVEYAIDNEALTFTPLYAGTYTVTYLYTDYCTEQEITYDIVVSDSDLVVFEDDILMPKYIIKGIEYPVVQMQGYTFVSGTQRKTAEFYVKEGNGAERLINGDTYSVQGDVTSVDLIYKIDGKQKAYKLPVIDAVSYTNNEYQVDLAKYFYNSVGSFNPVADSKKIKFEVANSNNGVAKLEVINPARLINDFNIGFHFETGKTNFTGVKVVLQGAYNSNETVEFKFEREVGTAAKVFAQSKGFAVEGSVSAKFRTPIIEDDNFNITYNATTKEFNISGFVVDANELLKNFDDLFYISFEIYGISGDSAINVTRVVNQKITNDKYDGVRPVVLYGSFKGYYVVGDEVKVNQVKIYDFVDPNPTCVVTLKNTAGYLTSTSGVKIDGKENDVNNEYFVNVENISRMSFKVENQDFSGNGIPISLNLMVRDVVAPTIELNVKNNVYKVGDRVEVADYVVADDVTAQGNLEVTYYLINPDGSVKYLPHKSFEIEKAGNYTIYYIVRDEVGNNAYASYSIIVE